MRAQYKTRNTRAVYRKLYYGNLFIGFSFLRMGVFPFFGSSILPLPFISASTLVEKVYSVANSGIKCSKRWTLTNIVESVHLSMLWVRCRRPMDFCLSSSATLGVSSTCQTQSLPYSISHRYRCKLSQNFILGENFVNILWRDFTTLHVKVSGKEMLLSWTADYLYCGTLYTVSLT